VFFKFTWRGSTASLHVCPSRSSSTSDKSDVMKILRRGLEQRLVPLNEARASAQRPVRGWLRAVREAIGMGQEDVAKNSR
jgi:hypothetical protein